MVTIIFVGIDVAKNKHDCYIFDSSKEIVETKFSFLNSFEGFTTFKNILSSYSDDFSNIKVGIESAGHYGNNTINFIRKNSLELKISVTRILDLAFPELSNVVGQYIKDLLMVYY